MKNFSYIAVRLFEWVGAKDKMFKRIFAFLRAGFLIFSFFVAGKWFLSKVFGTGKIYLTLLNPEFFSAFALVLSGLFFVGILQIWLLWKGVCKISFFVRNFIFPIIFLFFSGGIFLFEAFVRMMPTGNGEEFQSILSKNLLFSASWHFIERWGVLFFWMVFFSLICLLFGNFLLGVLKIRINAKEEEVGLLDVFLMGGVGFAGLTFGLFFLAFFGVLSKEALYIFFGFLVFFERKFFLDCLIFFFRKTRITLRVKSLYPLAVFLAIFLFCNSSLFSIQSFPASFDDSILYLNRAKAIAETKNIVPGGMPFPTELVFSFGYVFTDNAQPAFAFVFTAFFSIILLLFSFSRRFFGKKAGWFTLCVWLTTPMVWYFASFEAKVDIFLVFFSLLSVWLIGEWFLQRKKKYFFLGVFFLGFCIVIKLTAFFLVVGVSVSLFVDMFRMRKRGVYEWKNVGVAVIIGLIPVLFWWAYAVSTKDGEKFFSFQKETLSKNLIASFSSRLKGSAEIRDENLNDFGIDTSLCKKTGEREDYGRYIDWNTGIKRYFLFPWTVTFNERIGTNNLEVGCFYLSGFFLFIFWFLGNQKKEKMLSCRKIFIFLLVTSGVYVVLWTMFAYGVVWYGLPGFAILSVFFGGFFSFISREEKILRGTLFVILTILIIVNFIFVYRVADPLTRIVYLGKLTDSEFAKERFPITLKLADFFNSHEEGNIYTAPTPNMYFFERNQWRVFSDAIYDTFMCLDQEGVNDVETVRRLQQLHFRYFLRVDSLGFFLQLKSEEDKKTYLKKTNRVDEFLKRNLNPVFTEGSYTIFEIPK